MKATFFMKSVPLKDRVSRYIFTKSPRVWHVECMTTQASQPQGDPSIVSIDPLLLQSPFGPQQVLFHHVHPDDVVLLEQEDNAWIRVVRELD